jgi:hypothetical protein
MLQHRFRDQLGQPSPVPAATGFLAGFVACPCLASPGLVMAPPAFLAAVYQAAQERAAAQVRPARRAIPAFSLN